MLIEKTFYALDTVTGVLTTHQVWCCEDTSRDYPAPVLGDAGHSVRLFFDAVSARQALEEWKVERLWQAAFPARPRFRPWRPLWHLLRRAAWRQRRS